MNCSKCMFSVAFSVGLCAILSRTLLFESTTTCVPNDGPFSCSYYEARKKFREDATNANAKLDTLPIGLPSMESDLTIDIAYVGSESPAGLVIHISGTHGVEAHAGSAIQVAWLRQLANDTIGGEIESSKFEGKSRRDENGIGLVMVHVLNPYGMANRRRWNENNVDLNRNVLTDSQWDQVRKTGGKGRWAYEQFDKSLLNPAREPSWIVSAVYLVRAAYYIAIYGFVNLKRAVVTGQYYNSKGIFFGGDKLQSSHYALGEYFKSNAGLFEKVKKIVTIDVHTGLGPSGKDTLMTGTDSECKLFSGYYDCDSHSSSITDVIAGYEDMIGSTRFLFEVLQLDVTDNHVFVCQEFGTLPGVFVLRELIMENMAHHYGSPAKRYTHALRVRDAFYVRNDKWEKSVLNRGTQVLNEAISAAVSD